MDIIQSNITCNGTRLSLSIPPLHKPSKCIHFLFLESLTIFSMTSSDTQGMPSSLHLASLDGACLPMICHEMCNLRSDRLGDDSTMSLHVLLHIRSLKRVKNARNNN